MPTVKKKAVRKGAPKCKHCNERLMGFELNGTLCSDCMDQETADEYWRQAALNAMSDEW